MRKANVFLLSLLLLLGVVTVCLAQDIDEMGLANEDYEMKEVIMLPYGNRLTIYANKDIDVSSLMEDILADGTETRESMLRKIEENRSRFFPNDKMFIYLDTDDSFNGDNGDPDRASASGINRIHKVVQSNRLIGAGPILFGGWPCYVADVFVHVRAGTVELYSCSGSGCGKGEWHRRAIITTQGPFLLIFRGEYEPRGFRLKGTGARVSFAAGFYTTY